VTQALASRTRGETPLKTNTALMARVEKIQPGLDVLDGGRPEPARVAADLDPAPAPRPAAARIALRPSWA
jgi:hypothetical protein